MNIFCCKKRDISIFGVTKTLFFIFVSNMLLSSWTIAAYHYVRSDAIIGGDGGSWGNAYVSLPSVLVRGDTYFIADGTYPKHTFNDIENEENFIIIKKALPKGAENNCTGDDCHGSDTGWSDSYGDGQAIFDAPLTFQSSYWVFDGGKGSGKTGYGFKVKTLTSTCSAKEYGIKMPPWATHPPVHFITVQHVELEGCGADYDYGQTGIYSPSKDPVNNLMIANNYIHGYGHAMLLRSFQQDCVIEKNYMADGWSSAVNHGEAISEGGGDGFVIRYNIVENFVGTGHFNFGKGPNFGYSDNVKIYGNIHINQEGQAGLGNGAYGVEEGELMRGFKIYNNTFINLKGHRTGIYVGNGKGNEIFGNLFFQCENPRNYADASGGLTTGSNKFIDCSGVVNVGDGDFIGTGDPFVDWGNENYKLKDAQNSGLDLAFPYNLDRDNVVRGSDGIWDIGALEFTKEALDVMIPSPKGFGGKR